MARWIGRKRDFEGRGLEIEEGREGRREEIVCKKGEETCVVCKREERKASTETFTAQN
jgi:hypothetical protein